MDNSALAALAIFAASIVAIMAPFEAQTLRNRTRQQGQNLGWAKAFSFGLFTASVGVMSFLIVFSSICFGIPYLLGDMAGLLSWYTALPGLAMGFLFARGANKLMVAILLGSLGAHQ
jgi:hypothetical protein